MTLFVTASLFFTLFALILGVPRAMNRHRRPPEEGTFAGLAGDLAALDTALEEDPWAVRPQVEARRLSSR